MSSTEQVVENTLVVIDQKEFVRLTTENALNKLKDSETAVATISPYMELKVNGVDDKEGYERVHEARMRVRTIRTDLEKSREQLKSGVLEVGRSIDAEAKRIKALILPVETHLLEQEDIVKKEQERLEKIKQDEKDAEIKSKLELLSSFGVVRTANDIKDYSDAELGFLLKDSEEKFLAKQAKEEAERQRLAQEAENNRLEAERLKVEREAQEAEIKRLRAEQAAEAAKLKAERDAMEAQQKAERDRQAAEREAQEAEQRRQAEAIAEERRKLEAEKQRLEREEFERQAKIKADAEAKANVERMLAKQKEDEERLKADEAARLDRERIAAEEAARQAELMKTDIQRIGDLAKAIEDVFRPVVESDEAKQLVDEVFKLLDKARLQCNLRSYVKRVRGK